MIQTLINKQDTVEIVRDKIAQILANESRHQMNIAQSLGKDSKDWQLKVYTERTSPWESFLEDDPDPAPIINVWFDSEGFSEGLGNTVEMQRAQGVFNIDCIGYGSAKATKEGHDPADMVAAFEAARAIRLVRNIVMSSEYTYLDLRGTVSKRWPQSINAFRIQSESGSIQKCMGMRLALSVTYPEFSPQALTKNLEAISVDIQRAGDGSVIAEADYNYPLTGE